MATDKKEALASALKQIEKDFGKGSIMRLGDAKAHMNVEVIPTGILPLDIALGVGGVQAGGCLRVQRCQSGVHRRPALGCRVGVDAGAQRRVGLR